MYLVFEFQKFGKNLKHFSKAKNLSKNLLFLGCKDLAPVFLGNVCILGTLFDEIKSSNYLQIAIVFGLQNL